MNKLRKPLMHHVGIDLSGRDIGMPQQHLQGAQICATRQHVAGEGMP